MMPYKTKFTPDFKLVKSGAWGKEYKKADYPVRDKKEVQLFDIREFVKEKKKEKMAEILGNNDSDNNNSGGIGMMPGMNPLFNDNLFSSMNPSMPSPIASSDTSFNVDDLVKRIDAKIAELEEEERREKEAMEKKEKIEAKTDTTVEKEIQLPKENVVYKEEVVYDKDTDDDAFFDDFFSDD